MTDRAEQRSPLHPVSAWAAVTALPKLPAILTLRGKVVTADAMRCQRQAAWRSR